ncbi:MAG: helix-turn-helix transcriptional regulator [Bdellovibrio sp.]|nr:helix-turn-helix transcriptional regulator [Bdellovibrio sp.]
MNDFKSQQIKTVLKDLLRKKKMTYEMVAAELSCSVPTVKRILGPEELSLSRLLEFCELLNVTLSDIEMLTKASQNKVENFSEAQEAFLAKNGHFLTYLMKLYEMTPEQIAEKYSLSARSSDKYLLTLEKMELIIVNAKQKVRPAFKQLPSLGHGVLAKAHLEKFVTAGSHFFIRNLSDLLYSLTPQEKKSGRKNGYSLNALTCTENTYRNYVDEMSKINSVFLKQSEYEEKSLPPEQLKTAVIMTGWAYVESDYKELKMIENVLGEIKNI